MPNVLLYADKFPGTPAAYLEFCRRTLYTGNVGRQKDRRSRQDAHFENFPCFVKFSKIFFFFFFNLFQLFPSLIYVPLSLILTIHLLKTSINLFYPSSNKYFTKVHKSQLHSIKQPSTITNSSNPTLNKLN